DSVELPPEHQVTDVGRNHHPRRYPWSPRPARGPGRGQSRTAGRCSVTTPSVWVTAQPAPSPAPAPGSPSDQAPAGPSVLGVGVVVWLASELMFFAGLFAAYFTLRAVNDVWPPE